MKFELKTENENFLNSFLDVSGTFFNLSVIILLCFVTLRLDIISRHYQIDYRCKILSVEKSKSNFQKLSRLSNLKTKQRIWDFCMEVIK